MIIRPALLLCASAIALACTGCGASHDRHSYDIGRDVSADAHRIAQSSGSADMTESCREAVRARFSGELMFRDAPAGIDMPSAIAGCVEAG